ncbi:MAG: MFS transporter [Clostridia bacterium]|nr:MFS transporter [Clostridia bacterium]
MVRSLDKKWKEFLYAFSGFGPNFLMVLMGAYFTNAINPAAMGGDTYQVIMKGTCFILPAVFPILYAIAKAFDGIIDIPFAHITDTLSTRWGRRRPPIALCFIPMVISYAFCWWPIGGADGQLINTVWIIFWALVFFSTYTMCMIAFYGSLSTVCDSENQRLRVSGFKSFFDTISYCIVYALVPVILSGFQLYIDQFAFCVLPLMLTITIPLFMIKEGKKYGYPELQGAKAEKIKIVESIKLTFGNKLFIVWEIVNCCAFFGLQMFLSSMNALIEGGMGFNGLEMTLINTCAFAPVPIMLYLFNKLKDKKGVRFTYQTCLLSFGVSILSFLFASLYVTGGNKTAQYIISCVGGIMSSWAIGSFFMMPYLVPSQISGVEEKLTGKNHSAMYFAGQAVCTSVVGAISASLVWENVKMLFISKAASGVVYAENAESAALKLGVGVETVFNFGVLIVPIVVCIMCLVGFFVAFKMPKNYTHEVVAKELKRQDPSLQIEEYLKENKDEEQEKGEILFVQIGLSVLSGFIFGFVWIAFLFRSLKAVLSKPYGLGRWLLACFVPYAGVVLCVRAHKRLEALGAEKGVKITGKTWVHILLGAVFTVLPLNIGSLALLQHNVNKIMRAEESAA